jgi:CPA2 family monovalent cation:H+ antiporter-2
MLTTQTALELVALFGAATFVTLICHYLTLPSIVGFLITGMVVGPSGFKLIQSLPSANTLAEIAGVLLMFTIGLEFSFKKLLKLKNELLTLGAVQTGVTIMLVAILTSQFLDFSTPKAIFCGFLVSLSSTALVMKLLQDARETETPYGKHGVSILLAQDLAVIPMVVALPILATGESSLPHFNTSFLIKSSLMTSGVLAAVYLSSRYVVPFLFDKVVKTRSRELFNYCVLFLTITVCYLFHIGGLSVSLGAFAAGMIISESPYGKQVTSDIVPLRDNFLGIFFATVGMMLDLNFVLDHFMAVIGIIIAILLVKAFVIFIACVFNRAPFSIAAFVALMLTQIGEFSFIIASAGLALGLYTQEENQYFLSASVITMALTPYLFKLAPKIAQAKIPSQWKFLSKSAEARSIRAKASAKIERSKTLSGHTIIVGYGIAGQNLAAALESINVPFSIVEMNYESVKNQEQKGIKVVFGDASKLEVLEHAGIEDAKLIVVVISGQFIASILRTIRQIRPDIQVIVRAQYVREVEKIDSEHNTEVVVAEIETSIELLARAMRIYGVEGADIQNYMQRARNQLMTFAALSSNLSAPVINLPSWEALSSIKPLRLQKKCFANGKTIIELDLRRLTNTSVVSVYRDGIGSTVPDPNFTLSAGDVVHLVGSEDQLQLATRYLKTGEVEEV